MEKSKLIIEDKFDGHSILVESPDERQWFRIRVATDAEGNTSLDIQGSRGVIIKPEASNSINISIRK